MSLHPDVFYNSTACSIPGGNTDNNRGEEENPLPQSAADQRSSEISQCPLYVLDT